MKEKTTLSVAFWGNAILTVLGILGAIEGVVTLTQIAPFAIFATFIYGMLYRGKNFKVAAILLSTLMLLINIGSSDIDVFLWVLNLILVII